jgi:hypothetical protein
MAAARISSASDDEGGWLGFRMGSSRGEATAVRGAEMGRVGASLTTLVVAASDRVREREEGEGGEAGERGWGAGRL